MIPVSILQSSQYHDLLRMKTVSEAMQTEVNYVSPNAELLSIAQIMALENIASVVIAQKEVVGTGKKVFPVGIIVKRDVELLQALKLDLANIQAKTVMNKELFSVRAADSLLNAFGEMQRRNLQQLVVIGDAEELVGIVTQTSCLQASSNVKKKDIYSTEAEQKLEEKTSRLIQVTHQLRSEINQRQQSQQAYRQVSIELEKQVAQGTAELLKVNQELSTSLEEQNVFEEELRQQNEELFVANENAKLQQQRYENLFEFAPDAYLVTDANGKIQEANLKASNLFSVSRKYLIGKPIFVFIAKPDRKSFRTQVNLLERVEDWECYIKPRKATPINATITMTSIHDKNGNLVGKRLMIRDITERKQSEEKIKQQAALLDITTDAIMVCNLENQILFWNQGAESLYEWLEKEVINQNFQDLNKNDSPQLELAFANVLDGNYWQGELQQVTKSGKEIVVFSRWILMRDEQDNPKSILIVNTDITEKKLLEAQYYRAQRLESLGILASGIAHDLNNILTPILTGSQLLPRKLPHLDEKNRLILKMLEDNSKRGAELVKQITSFARGAKGDRIPIQLRHLIKEIQLIVKSTFPKLIEFSTNIPTRLWTVKAQPTQIHQILMNLCINARDAMPEGGTLSITAENRVIDETYSSMNSEAKVGDYVAIRITDTGCGMPQEILNQIFEPFFTTKEVGKGTGLGLSTTIGIVKSHGGFVEVSSQVGKGSQFEVYLPASPNQEVKQTSDSGMSEGKGELILVVDDEKYIREMTENSLLTHNYRILTANDGYEAFSLYVKYKDEINLVLIDIHMPSINGLEVIKVLQRMNPDVKIIAMSGIESNRQLLAANDINVEAFLSKPYTLGKLLEEIKVVLKKVKG
ncbi:PAS domain S-box protein [Calothrix sp. CCY 0018]|uniref:PAS domain S-box protein n=1 Tax=Calothrix sp. CCY 0018 TaxID=3103864 RepID=UPI0039C74B7A